MRLLYILFIIVFIFVVAWIVSISFNIMTLITDFFPKQYNTIYDMGHIPVLKLMVGVMFSITVVIVIVEILKYIREVISR